MSTIHDCLNPEETGLGDLQFNHFIPTKKEVRLVEWACSKLQAEKNNSKSTLCFINFYSLKTLGSTLFLLEKLRLTEFNRLAQVTYPLHLFTFHPLCPTSS